MTLISETTNESVEINLTEMIGWICDTSAVMAAIFGDRPDRESLEYVSNDMFGHLVELIAEVSDKEPNEVYQAIRNELLEEEPPEGLEE